MVFRRKILLSLLILPVIFAFVQADDYFEISKNLEIFTAVYKTVNSDYVDEVKPGELMKKGIDAMLASLDPYTNFYTESQAEDAMIRQSGEYGGVGCQTVKRDDYIVITMIARGLAADKAGMQVGDKIIEINGKSLKGKNMDDIGESLKGAPGTKVSVLVERMGKPLTLEIHREEIKQKNVTFYGKINSKTAYIKLDQFMIGAATEVREALMKMKADGATNVVLDLRDNGGGLLIEAVRIVNIFVPAGQLVVVSKGRSPDAYTEYKTLDPATDADIPLIVLVNKYSASASEIVSGAIQDLDRGVIVGRNSFGKGLVQNVRPLVYRTQMKVTIAKYYIPSGRCIQLLDYSNRNTDGKAVAVPDSLKKTFKTKNGRTVLDGSGIKPDLHVSLPEVTNISTVLDKAYLIFDFATRYRSEHASISGAREFTVDDALFEEFKKFVREKTISFKNESEVTLGKLKDKLKDENYLSDVNTDLDKLQTAMAEARYRQMDKAKNEIIQLLKIEIGRRYFYGDAYYLGSFDSDPDIQKTLGLFEDISGFNSLLGKK